MTDRCGSAAHDCDQCRRDWLYTAKRSSSDLGAAEGRCRRIFARRDTIRKAGWRVGLGHEWRLALAADSTGLRSLILRPGSMGASVAADCRRDDRNHGRNLYRRLPGNDPWWLAVRADRPHRHRTTGRDRTDRIRCSEPRRSRAVDPLADSDPAVRLHGRGGANAAERLLRRSRAPVDASAADPATAD